MTDADESPQLDGLIQTVIQTIFYGPGPEFPFDMPIRFTGFEALYGPFPDEVWSEIDDYNPDW